MESKAPQIIEPGRKETQENAGYNIDTGVPAKIPNWAKDIKEHDTSLGVIEWSKEKYKDSLFFSPKQLAGKKVGAEELLALLKKQEIPVLNINVLNFLLVNKDQIPEEWRGKKIFFWGTIISELGGRESVCYLEEDGSNWISDHHWLDHELLSRMPAVMFSDSK